MSRDARLHFDPTTRRYHEAVDAKESELDASIPQTAWDAMLGPLSVAVLARARNQTIGSVSFPGQGDERCRVAFELLLARLQSGTTQAAQDPMDPILERRLAAYVSARVPANADVLYQTASLFHDWKARRKFSDGVPVAIIEQCFLELARPPTDPARCFESFGGLRDDLAAVVLTLDERRKKEGDEWIWLSVVERYADEAHLSPEYSLRSELLARAGPAEWLTWAAHLPHAVFAAIAVNDVDDLDFIERLLEHCHEAAASEEARRLVLVLLIRRAIQLWDQVDRSLTRVAALTYGIEEADRTEYQQWRDAWSGAELKDRASRVADILASSSDGVDAAFITARHLREHGALMPAVASPVRKTFRDELLPRLAQLDLDATTRKLLGVPPVSAGLLAAALLTSRSPSDQRVKATLDGYAAWLSSESFFWKSPLESHEREVVDAVALVLAHAKAPTEEAKTLLARVGTVSQGWGFDLDAWFDAVPKTAHVLIVAACAAADALNRGRANDATDLMELAWSGLDSLIRDAPMGITDGRVWSAIAYVWAHASRVFQGAGARIGAALVRFDDIRMMISAAQNFTSNAGPLPVDAQRALRDAFNTRRVILERHPHVTEEAVAELRATLERLTPDA